MEKKERRGIPFIKAINKSLDQHAFSVNVKNERRVHNRRLWLNCTETSPV